MGSLTGEMDTKAHISINAITFHYIQSIILTHYDIVFPFMHVLA